MAIALRVIVVVGVSLYGQAAYSQALSYDHRSTVEGDRLSGAADLEAASGRATLHRAQAYDRQMEAQEKVMQLEYAYYQFRRQVAADQIEWRERRADSNRQRDASQESQRDAAAMTMLNRVQLGLHLWPEALNRPAYASSMSTIESILRTWRESTAFDSAFSARALATEAAVLEARVAADHAIAFPDRLRAVRALRLVQRIPFMEEAKPVGRSVLASNR